MNGETTRNIWSMGVENGASGEWSMDWMGLELELESELELELELDGLGLDSSVSCLRVVSLECSVPEHQREHRV